MRKFFCIQQERLNRYNEDFLLRYRNYSQFYEKHPVTRIDGVYITRVKITMQTTTTRFQKFLYLNEMTENTKKISLKYFKVLFSSTVAFAIYETFLILYVLEFITFAQLGIILAIRFAIQALLDYPTGALADLIGHKRVLLIAYIGHIMSISVLLLNPSFKGIMIAYILSAISMSQESGALISWYDNRYNLEDGYDKDRKTYGAFHGRIQTFNTLVLGLSFVIGGLIAQYYSRKILFVIHLIMLIVTTYFIIRELDGKLQGAGELNSDSYFSQLASGINFLRDHPGINIIFIGIAINGGVIWTIWGSLMLFPTYHAYGGSDEITGLIRSSIFIIGVFWSFYAASLSKKVDRTYLTIVVLNFLGGSFFLVCMYLFQSHVSPGNGGELFPILGLMLVFQLVSLPMNLGDILNRRVFIQLIPNELRNTVYSLLPSMVTLVGIPAALLGGWAITNIGFVPTILIISGFTGVGTLIMAFGFYTLSQANVTHKPVVKPENVVVS